MELYDWKWYEANIADLFSKIEGVIVEHNVKEMGLKSHTERQIDISISYPMNINIGQGFDISIPIQVDFWCHLHVPEQIGHHSGRNRPPCRSKSATPAG